MKVPLHILSISAGQMDNDGDLYASVIVLEDAQSNQIDSGRIDVGQKHAKVKVVTDGNNAVARALAVSGQVPGVCLVSVTSSVRKLEMVMKIIDFSPNK